MMSSDAELRELDDAASKLLEITMGRGGQEAEVCASYGHRTKISLEKQDYHLASADEGCQLGVRVLIGSQQGFASCNSTDDNDLKEIALRAIEIAKFSPPNPNYVISRSEGVSAEAPPPPWDECLSHLSLQTQKDWTKLMVEEATRDTRFRLNEGALGVSRTFSMVRNSKGTLKTNRDCSVYWSLMGMAAEGATLTSFDYFSNMSREANGTPDQIVSTTRKFRDQLLANLSHGRAKSYKGLALFTPRAVCEIFLSTLAYHLNGRILAESRGRWARDDLGKKVLDDRLSLRDAPWLEDRAGFCLFDREGTPTRNRPLIENGILKDWLLDSYSAKALRLSTTGNASGGPTAAPSVAAHSLVLAPGSEAFMDAIKRLSLEQNEFLVIHRYSGQTDPVTGDFSGVAKGGEWWQEGVCKGFVKETLISGNTFEILDKGVFSVSRETELIDASEESPTLILDGISVTSS